MNPRIYPALTIAIFLSLVAPGVMVAQAVSGGANSGSSQRQNRIVTAIGESQARLQSVDSQIKKQAAVLAEKSVSEVAFEDVFRMLHIQKAELAIELAGLNARVKLLKQKTEASTSGDKASESADVKAQRRLLERFVANQRKVFDQYKSLHSKGARSASDLRRGEQLLIQAQLRLKEFEVERNEGSSSLVDAVLETSLEIAEKTARQETVEKMLRSYSESRDEFAALKDLKRTRESMAEFIEELNREMRSSRIKSDDF